MVRDLDLKKFIIENGLDCKVRTLERNIYLNTGIYYSEKNDFNRGLVLQSFIPYDDLRDELGDNVFRVIKNLNRSFYNRRRTVMQRVEYMVNHGNCIFLTFTFTDYFLESTSSVNRRRYVREYLSSYNSLYLANIDFGVKDEYVDKLGISHKGTHREHYHAVILVDEVDYSKWRYGSLNGLKVRKVEDSQAIATYITKLSNHACKSSTYNYDDLFKNRVIYSKLWKEVIL